MGRNVHTEPSSGGWSVREEGHRSSKTFSNQTDAIAKGRELAQRNQSEHVIHGRDGRILQSDSFSKDPFPPKVP